MSPTVQSGARRCRISAWWSSSEFARWATGDVATRAENLGPGILRAYNDGGFNRSLQQELVEPFAGSIPFEGLAWSSVKAVGGGVEVGFGEASEADAFGEVLA